MRIALDTDVLLRVVIDDDRPQTDLAIEAIDAAEQVVVSTVILCEFVWVLRSRYRMTRSGIAAALRQLIRHPRMQLDRLAAEAGLAALNDGGDFADGVIAHEAERARADRLLTFDRAFAARARSPRATLLA